MLVFRTQFPIQQTTEIKEIIQIATDWIQNSPHTNLKDQLNDLKDSDNEFEISVSGETLIFNSYIEDSNSIIGLIWSQNQDNLEWNSTFIANKTENSFWISIEIECDQLKPSPKNIIPKKPYIIKLLHSLNKHTKDGDIIADGLPHNLEDFQIAFAAKMLNGNCNNIMPVVYVSSTFNNKYVLNPTILAEYLYGMAHVIVEPNPHFSNRLKIDTNYQNAHRGAIGIYWPEGIGKEIVYRENLSHRQLVNNIYDIIRKALLSMRLKYDCTWIYLQQKLNQQKRKELEESGNKNLDEYIVNFDKEIHAKDQQIKEAEQVITELKQALHKANIQVPAHRDGNLLKCGIEPEFYNEEFLYHIISSLKKTYSSCANDSRKKAVLKSFIDVNILSNNVDIMKKRIKDALGNYNGLDKSTTIKLEDAGFTIDKNGPHHKLIFCNDDRYTIILSKTPGDKRTGPNTISDINKKIF